MLDPESLAALREKVQVAEMRRDRDPSLADQAATEMFGVVTGLAAHIDNSPPNPWPPLPLEGADSEQYRPWLLTAVYERLRAGQGEFLAELRPAVALFLRFGGIDYDRDEEAGSKLDCYIRAVQQVLARYDGTLLQVTLGDKGSYLYAAFGAPHAHEDDAERAASAALELVAPGVQIGLAQGRTRTGAYGSTTRRTYGVLGDAVNLAARLMQAAASGEVLATRSVAQASGRRFAWHDLPPLRVKGKTAPEAVCRLVGRSERAEVRLQEPTYPLPMVGRQAELALVEEKLSLALAGRGQIVAITGEAGMGKSRLLAEATRLALGRGLCGYGGECQSFGANISYLVWQPIWRAFFGVGPGLSIKEQVRTLEDELLRLDPTLAPRMPLLAAVLNLPIPDNELTRGFDAKLRKTSLEALLADCLRLRATESPLLLVLEDCHWLDPVSHDLLDIIGRAAARLPVLVLMAYRPPEIDRLKPPRVSSLPHFTEIRLTELGSGEASQLIRQKLAQLTGTGREPPPALVDQITARGQGNPFYMEELLNYIQDRGIDLAGGPALETLDLPTSLHSLVLSRIDRLDEGPRSTLRVASVVGRVFKASMLWDVHPPLGGAGQVIADLEVLQRLDLTPVDNEAEGVYLFKHIVTQEVAYQSLPFATRAGLHERVGQHIESAFAAEGLEGQIDLLAHHFDRSENLPKRRTYLLRAGELAQKRYANAAAMDYFQRVLPLLPEPDQAPVMLKLGKVLELVGQWTGAETLYAQALELADRLGDPAARARCATATGDLLRKRGRYGEAASWLAQARAGFEALADRAGLGEVCHHAGTLAGQQGDFASARELFEESLAIRRELGDRLNAASLLNNLANIARAQGDPELARSLQEQCLAVRQEMNDPWGLAIAHNNLGNLAIDRGDYAPAHAHFDAALAIMRTVGDRWLMGNFLNNQGNAARAQGDYPRARGLYAESLRIYRDFGDRWALAYLLEDTGGLAACEGRAEHGLRLAGQASLLREAIGAPLSAFEHSKLERLLAPARQALPDGGAAAWQEGQALPLEQSIEDALAALRAQQI